MKVKVELQIEIEGDYKEKDVEELLKLDFGINSCPSDNPLIKDNIGYEIENFYMEVL